MYDNVQKMSEKPLVSIITPCYNGERVMHRLLESILKQTYKSIEFLFVNDGSTDRTEDVFMEFKPRMEAQGIRVIYIKQQNRGLGGAIDAGLKLFTGEYLCWPDADDFLMPESVAKRVSVLEQHPEYGCVSSNAYVYDEGDLDNPIKRVTTSTKVSRSEKQFIYMLRGQSIFCPGCHMVRVSAFIDVNPQRSIYPARRGQNWQMLLPVYYKYRRYFLDEPLYGYVVSASSMSRGDDTPDKRIMRIMEHREIVFHTLGSMRISAMFRWMYKNIFLAVGDRALAKQVGVWNALILGFLAVLRDPIQIKQNAATFAYVIKHYKNKGVGYND